MDIGVIILAAGQGTRMRSELPKVLHRLAGTPLLGYVLDAARALEPAQIRVVYGHGGEQVPQSFPDPDIAWVEQTRQLGTGHAVQQALPLTRASRVLVLYGDVPLIRPETLRRLVAETADSGLGVLGVTLPDPTGYGRILRDGEGRILRIVEQKDASPAELAIREVNTGILVVDRARLVDWLGRVGNQNAQGEFYLTDIIGLAVTEGVRVASLQAGEPEEVLGVNDRAQLAHLERFHQRAQALRLMREGVTLADPGRLDLRGRLVAGQDVFIDLNGIFEGHVELGDGVSIGPNCLIRDSRIGPGTRVEANCVIEEAQVGAEARIGPFARLRPGTVLADRVHVGNFVELKQTRVDSGSKINHLSYLGDCAVGAAVNIGAGTITCNYDGVNKHGTQIGDRAFIGSNSSLVAPVHIGPGATIGAGSVITRDAPANQLTLARGRQETIPGWRPPRKKT